MSVIARPTAAMVAVMASLVLTASAQVLAHGSMETPVSRVYNCFQEGPENPKSAACKEAVRVGGTQALYDWNGVNQGNANGQHRDVVPDGRLCGAGKDLHKGLDLARDDWPSTSVAPDRNGRFEFVYRATAPHATKRFAFYVTEDGYDPNKPLAWSDLESRPFCTIDNVRLENGRYRMDCPLPQGKTGKHVIYNVWDRSDSPEAFYACIDVAFSGDGGMTTPWRELGQLRARNGLSRDSQARLRLFNGGGQDQESHSLVASDGRIEPADWPFELAQIVNAESDAIRIGVLDDDGTVAPTRSASDNRVYTRSDAALSFEIDITAASGGGEPGDGGGNTGGGDPDPGTGEAWHVGLTYVAGDLVTHEGSTYRAKWWSRGDEPVVIADAPWETPWELVDGSGTPPDGSGGDQAWTAGKAYVAGDLVSHAGSQYRAKWWSRGFAPDTPVENAWETPWEPAG